MKKYLWVGLLLGSLYGFAALAAEVTRPDLTGQVLGANGQPVPQATVFIYTARPKVGSSSLCPSCYADCKKQARTDAAGQFKIAALDPALIFRLLIVAPGYASQYETKVDPATGARHITLQPLSAAMLKSPLRIRGVVVDERGKPLPGAELSPEGVSMDTMTRWGGIDEYVEPMAVADDQGHFVLLCRSNIVTSVHVLGSGRGAAAKWLIFQPGQDYIVKMEDGATVSGQVTEHGQPAKNVSVGLMTVERECGKYYNCNSVVTDDTGHYQIWNVPAGCEYNLFTTMDSMAGRGSLPLTKVRVGPSGSEQEVKPLEIGAACVVRGRVVLSDGKPLPAGTPITLSREDVNDGQEVQLDASGRFEFKDVPAGPIGIWVRLKGYHVSKRNPSLDWLNGRILGRLEGDASDFVILLDPGEWNRDDRVGSPGGDDEYPREKPLRSVSL
ncbi:MAG TPA: carboxypeptidase-like regulatory domain-containing protein [Verrucomicrobiae bacterium]